MKLKALLLTMSVVFLIMGSTIAALAQDEPEVPAPYAGVKNPFPWSDTSTQEAGKGLYQQQCSGCHGVDGSNIAVSDFSAADFPRNLEERPDLFFWILSEGMLDKGMPPYKSSLSENQRWELLTYIWLLGAGLPEPTPTEGPAEGDATLLLTAPEQAQAGEPLTLTAVLDDSEGKPIGNTMVRFFINVDFFASGLMEIGDAMTDDQGVAVFEYIPRLDGAIELIARSEGDAFGRTETITMITIAGSDEPFYKTEVGLDFPAPGDEVFIGPQSARELGEMGKAPTSAFRLPGGILSWLLLFVVIIVAIFSAYVFIMYQVFRISTIGQTRDIDVRLVPVLGMIIAIGLGIFVVLMIVTGPDSHFHLP